MLIQSLKYDHRIAWQQQEIRLRSNMQVKKQDAIALYPLTLSLLRMQVRRTDFT